MFANIKSLVSISSLDCKKTVKLLSEWKCLEAVLRRCSVKKLFLRISENSQENTCTEVSFYQSYRSPVLSCEFCEIFKNTYFVKDWWTAAFENHVYLNSIEQFPEFQSDGGNQKFRRTFWNLFKTLPRRIGNDLRSEKLSEKSYGDRVFCFPGGSLSVF